MHTNSYFLAVAQAAMNVAAAGGACSAPLIIGALTKANAHTGWRNFYVRAPRIVRYYISHDIFSGFKWLYGA